MTQCLEFGILGVLVVLLIIWSHKDHLKHVYQGKLTLMAPRSGKWVTVRRNHLDGQPGCALCGGTTDLNVHHIKPFHIQPELELDPNNLITLCESKSAGINCHLAFGHLGNFKSFNATVVDDVRLWGDKIKNRPR